jgi:pimeloyl-ACP methyl ester carboxylesterase
MNDTMRHTKVNGLSIAFLQAGNGPALILLHGGANTNSRMWKPQVAGLSENFTVIAWDAPGAGLSDDPPEGFKMDNWADHLAGFLDSIGHKKAHVLGLSWGAVLAQVFYQRHPNYVLSLVLCGAYTGWKSSLSDSIANERLAAALHDITLPPKVFASKYLPSMFSDSAPQDVKEELSNIISSNFHPIGCRLIFMTMVEVDTKALLPRIKVPTLLIWGEADKRSPLSVAHQFHGAIPNSKLEILSHAGHVSNMENPGEFNKIVKDFCISISMTK